MKLLEARQRVIPPYWGFAKGRVCVQRQMAEILHVLLYFEWHFLKIIF
jgi:hypothetical protein